MPHRWGGYAEPTFSDISFFPDMFSGNWPPPESATIKLTWIDDGDETGGQVIFDGSARRAEPDYDKIKYTLKRTENTTKVAESTAYADTLNAVMATLCGSTLLNLTLDTTRARIPSPAVAYTTTAEVLTIDLASEMCAFFGHGFYTDSGTLYLVDMYDISEQTEVDEFDITGCSLKDEKGYSSAKSGDYNVTSATVLNESELSISTAYHTVQANIEAALTIILEIANRPIIKLDTMITSSPQVIAGCYIINDENHYLPLQSIMLTSDIVYNFDSEKIQATGAGSIS